MGEVCISLIGDRAFIFLESSETYSDLVMSKIGAKLNNVVIYGGILVNFLRILGSFLVNDMQTPP